MDNSYTRQSALQFAVTLGHKDAASLVSAAETINAFLAAAPEQQLGLNSNSVLGSLNAQQSTQEKTEAPKATRQRRSSTASGETKVEEPSKPSQEASTETAQPSTDKETDDLFGDDPAPAKEEKVKEVTPDDVRAKLVEVQTKFKHKDHALACLKKISGGMVLSGLKKEDHGKLVDLCTEALKKDTPPKF